jgi:hypothetical protein
MGGNEARVNFGCSTVARFVMGMRSLAMFFLFCCVPCVSQAADSCMTIHGRLHLYGGDGQLRIWHIGTNHDFTPDDSSWGRVVGWLEEKASESDKKNLACAACANDLYADFLICPTEPYKKGFVQRARVISATHRRFVHTQ